ncbi:MAG: hypothetical protein EXS49_01470 [Candidatus Pacebacteria bacterium]|nr:hypothetical protein [Candidatus Paceibacterota bacterium]
MNFSLDFSNFIDIDYLVTNGSFWVVIVFQAIIFITILFIHYHFTRFSPRFDIGGKFILFIMDLLFLIVIYMVFQYFAKIYLS